MKVFGLVTVLLAPSLAFTCPKAVFTQAVESSAAASCSGHGGVAQILIQSDTEFRKPSEPGWGFRAVLVQCHDGKAWIGDEAVDNSCEVKSGRYVPVEQL